MTDLSNKTEQTEAGIETAIKNVINGLLQQVEVERQKDPNYQELFKGAANFESLLTTTQDRMIDPVVVACQILKEKFGVKQIGREAYMFLLALPLLAYLVEKGIKELEGPSCCVDKTYYLLAKMLNGKLEKNKTSADNT